MGSVEQCEQFTLSRAQSSGGGLGIRTPGGVITVAFTLGRRSYAQRIEQRFLSSRQPSVPIGFLCFLSLKYHQQNENAPPADGGTGLLLMGTALFQTATPTTTRR